MTTYQDLIDALEQARDRGELKFHTARTRITALKEIFSRLPELKAQEVFSIDKNELLRELVRKSRDDVSISTLATYVSRFNVSREFFKEFVDFEMISSPKGPPQRITVPIDGKEAVYISNLPSDMTQHDVEQIYRVLRMLAQ